MTETPEVLPSRDGGHIANIGVHGKPVTLHLEELWIRNVTITTGLVDTYSTPTLLKLAQGHQVDTERFVTHHFTLDQFDEAYDVFARAADTGALKVVLTRTCTDVPVRSAHHAGDARGWAT